MHAPNTPQTRRVRCQNNRVQKDGSMKARINAICMNKNGLAMKAQQEPLLLLMSLILA